jgi:lipopolysaccharide export system protein LptA
MKFRNPRSIIIISSYLLVNLFILIQSFRVNDTATSSDDVKKAMEPAYTIIEELDYFHLKEEVPQMSLSAVMMKSLGEEVADFTAPTGVYNYQEKNKSIRYSGEEGSYYKKDELLTLDGDVKVATQEATYLADHLKYFFQKDLLQGTGHIRFEGEDPKTKDHLLITSERMNARPNSQLSTFEGNVKGTIQRKKQYEGKTNFASNTLDLDGDKSLARLVGNVRMKRDSYDITSGKADIHLENYNKSLKYFVLNDDVKVTEKLQTNEGVQERKAFAERLEGFGREQKMVLSGAPRVEMGKDVIKGYRITIRENVDLIEVDDAMSDVQVKRKKLKD